MWPPNSRGSTMGRKGGRNGLVAVAMDKDKGSQYAIKWAIENLLIKGQTIVLIHIIHRSSTASHGSNPALHAPPSTNRQALEKHTKELFVTFHCFCTRKDIHCFDVVLEDTDIAKAITEYVAQAGIENLVLGASHHGFISPDSLLQSGVISSSPLISARNMYWRLQKLDVPSTVSKAAPDFCTVYVISKTKISSVRNASRPAPFASPLINQIQQMHENAISNGSSDSFWPDTRPRQTPSMKGTERLTPRKSVVDDTDLLKSPFSRGSRLNPSIFADLSESDTDISFISSDRPSVDRTSADPMSGILFDSIDSSRNSRISTSSESSFGSMRSGTKFSELSSFTDYSSSSLENEDVESEMRRLKLELQKTMEMYSTACKEALTAKQKAVELHRWRIEEERRLEEARLAEEAARMNAEQEKAKYKSAMEIAQAAQRIAEMESQKRVDAEKKAIEESDENDKPMVLTPMRYRRYTIEEIEEATEYFAESRKIGEGGYGPVFKCFLDLTPVAVKVLRPDAAQGRSQFHQEVEVLSCLRHPNMVLLLGACPEYGCLVYEYMANGSLEDRLFRKGNSLALSWQLRFRIAAEIATCLHFLHQTKPEPLVHRDLKPGNILLDRNYVSKIGDVGLARLVPPSVENDVTQYRMTSTAGTFCYIDPEYQQTGMLGVKSDVYSLGIVLLQILTARPAMGLAHHIERAIENKMFAKMLDPSVPDWPVNEALSFAKLALQCAELRRKDRPELGKTVLPELNKLRELAEENMGPVLITTSVAPSPTQSLTTHEEIKSDSQLPIQYSRATGPLCSASLPEKLSEAT